ncbi:MAG: NADH-quinone oxidoreductase subunit NuoF [Anaerolineae bacterium]|nr:MAG: NADH-quinone oxidoreductase subunit NuoF [Anaerolineae bacterium]
MPRLETAKDLEHARREIRKDIERRQQTEPLITVGMGTCGLSAGAGKVMEALHDGLSQHGLDVRITAVGCIGMCSQEPLVDIQRAGETRVTYASVRPDRVPRLIDEHLIEGHIVEEWMFGPLNPQVLYREPDGATSSWYEGTPFYDRQMRIAMRHCGLIDPLSIGEYIAFGGYSALVTVLFSMTPEQVIAVVKDSGLRGRGGAGFPTGLKWEFTRTAPGEIKYIIANGDEGDPGAFMDRSIMEGDPHSIIEGMIIGAFAIGVHEGYIYVRDEYPLAVNNLRTAIQLAEEYGLLGGNILDSGFNFTIKIVRGAGAFVCGESSALMASVEGRVGEPRPKHVHATHKGLWDRPTALNNVETWANVPIIINNGGEWYADIGTARSKGTKAFCLVGKIQNTGLIEVPMGITLREIIYDIGGGIPKGKEFKAVQTGGPSGGCIPESLLDLSVDYEQLAEAGSIMGSGGMIVMDENTCMVDVARYFVDFLKDESCGKCTACREGIRRMLEILTDITEGKGKEGDVELLEEIGHVVLTTSLCGLGKTAPNPVLSTIRYFRDEYDLHIKERKCPAGVCRELITFFVIPELCTGCGLCRRRCPQEAISGEKKEPHVIDAATCIRCGVCRDLCRFDAIGVS